MKKGNDEIDVPDNLNFLEFKNLLKDKKGIFLEIFKDKNVKFFLNLEEISNSKIKLKDGDQVAFLPPVTGG